MEIQLTWKGDLLFEGVADSGHPQFMDAERSVGGGDKAPRPMEYIALGLAGCTAMDVVSILEKKKQAVSDFRVAIHARRAEEHPKVFTGAQIEYLVSGDDVDEQAVMRAIELSAQKYCPAHAMLSRAFPISMSYKIFDSDGTLKREGEYIP